MAILQYEKYYKKSKKPQTLFKLSELNSKVRNFDKSLEYAEKLIDISLKTSAEELCFSQSSRKDISISNSFDKRSQDNKDSKGYSFTSIIGFNSLEQIYLNAIHCLKILAEESLDVTHVQKAIKYTK
mmetsp:Transcript_7403/g.6560  ORF Transcript_7403/g.6560 Transcript_7403/m.6560 type:complete len:127 (+) Transcript_7403:263-643(+)